MPTSLVITVIGPDRPGLVSQLSEVAQRYGANWAGSRMARLGGQFAGMAQLEIEESKAAALTTAFKELESTGLRIVVAESGATTAGPDARRLRLELVGHDRPGIVRDLSGSLAQLHVSIVELQTQVTSAAMTGDLLFKVRALIAVPESVSNAVLTTALEKLANDFMVDLEPA